MLSMSKAVKKTKTKYTGIYFNEKNKKYDIKYNYTIYNPDKQKMNISRSGNMEFQTSNKQKWNLQICRTVLQQQGKRTYH